MSNKSEKLFESAKRYIPGGVNSPVRAFKAVGGSPKFIKSALGSKIVDEDGNLYIDYVCSWGPLILGHAEESVTKAIRDAALDGTSYGAPCRTEVDLARMICESFKSIELVRMVSSGTEAVMSAARLARAYTDRDCILKFSGCYHGHSDSFLVQAGSGLATMGNPSSPGVTKGNVKDTLLCEYNDIEGVRKIFAQRGKDIAAVIVEPVAGNMGVVLPKEGFLEELRAITTEEGALLIFDEVITGFRLGISGAQGLYKIEPDLTTLGKIIGGGLPVGAYGGKKKIMSMISPQGPVYQAGTLSGNPLAMAAGIATLKYLIEKNPYAELKKKTERIVSGIREIVLAKDYPVSLTSIGSMFCLFFSKDSPNNWEEASKCDSAKYAKFFGLMLGNGVYVAPSQFETSFVSTAHSDDDIEETIEAYEKSLKGVFS